MIITLTPIANLFANGTEALTARFGLLCFMAVFNGFNIRTEHINLFTGISKNKNFVYIAISILASTIILCNAGELLKVCTLSLNQWLVITALAIMVIPIDLMRKAFEKREYKTKEEIKYGIIQ